MTTHIIPLCSTLAALSLSSCSSTAPDNIATLSSQEADTSSQEASASFSNLESEILDHVNHYRAQKGLPKLQPHLGLAKLARIHSDNMSQRDEMSHVDFSKRAKKAQKKHQMGAVSENLYQYWGPTPTGSHIVNEWINSPKHRDNMEGDFSHAGIAMSQIGDKTFTTLLLGQAVEPKALSRPPASFLVF